jgi:biopolymer transport protein ExbB
VVALFIIFERLFNFHRAYINTPEFLQGLFNVLKRNNIMEAITICDETPGPVAHTLRAALIRGMQNQGSLEIAAEEASLAEVPRLERNLKVLATIAQITPLLGLLGTVIGLIGLFYVMEEGGALVETSKMAGHIWPSLLTTAAGLTVSIPCYAFYNLFVSKVENLLLEVDKARTQLVEFVFTHNLNLEKNSAEAQRYAGMQYTGGGR